MSAGHTPGPWTPRFGETYSIREEDGGQLAILTNLRGNFGLGGRRDGKEVAANARLIAAAPTMLDALIAADLAMAQGGLLSCHATRKEIAAAIAMAVGEQP